MVECREFVLKKSNYLPHQWEFMMSESTRLCLASGYGGGKTYCFLRKVLLCHLTKLNPKKKNKSNGWVIYPTYDLAEELFTGEFIELLESLEIKYNYNVQKHRIVTGYGTIRIHSLQNPRRIVGGNLTFVAADEFDVESSAKVQATYDKAVARLRGCVNAPFFTVSTLEGYKTLHKIFFENPSPEKHLVRAKSTDNPFLPEGYIEGLRRDYDSLMQLQYIDGIPQNLNGSAAYYQFLRTTHLRHCKHLDIQAPDKQYYNQLWIGIDFNVQPMTASCAIMIDSICYEFKEYWLQSGNTRRMCQIIREDYPDRPIIACPDMTGDSHHTNASNTDIDILREFGFEIRGRYQLPQKDRLNVTNNALEKQQIFIDPSCVHLIMDMERVILVDNHIDKSEETAPNFRTHMSDAADYRRYQQFKQTKHGQIYGTS